MTQIISRTNDFCHISLWLATYKLIVSDLKNQQLKMTVILFIGLVNSLK